MDGKKRPANSRDNGRRARPREDNGSQTATDEEAEEFFAILRQVHAAGKQLQHSSGNGRDKTEKWERWRPEFKWEDFAGPNAVNPIGAVSSARFVRGEEAGSKRGEEKTGANAVFGRLDLNAEPEPEQTVHSSG